jgi:hypothetical protein
MTGASPVPIPGLQFPVLNSQDPEGLTFVTGRGSEVVVVKYSDVSSHIPCYSTLHSVETFIAYDYFFI